MKATFIENKRADGSSRLYRLSRKVTGAVNPTDPTDNRKVTSSTVMVISDAQWSGGGLYSAGGTRVLLVGSNRSCLLNTKEHLTHDEALARIGVTKVTQ